MLYTFKKDVVIIVALNQKPDTRSQRRRVAVFQFYGVFRKCWQNIGLFLQKGIHMIEHEWKKTIYAFLDAILTFLHRDTSVNVLSRLFAA